MPAPVDEQTAAEIQRVIEYANAHKFDLASVSERFRESLAGNFRDGTHGPALKQPEFCCTVGAYRCCYTVEDGPYGYVKHLHVWTEQRTIPMPEVVIEIAKHFGYHSNDVQEIAALDVCCNVVNLVEPIGH